MGFLIKLILIILSFFYLAAVKTRLGFYRLNILKAERLKLPVISVGNITWGGTGKTPLSEIICSYFSSKGRKAAILTRGYGADEDKALTQNLEDTIVLAGKDRVKNARSRERKGGVELFLLDDGFQHLRINRDLDIVAVSAAEGFGNRLLIPAGPLREPLTHLRRADLIVLTRSDMASSQRLDEIEADIFRFNPDTRIFRAVHEPILFEDGKGQRRELESVKHKKVCAVSGLADNISFIRALKKLGADVALEFSYMDHHRYSRDDLDNILKGCGGNKIDTIVTTQKDWVKIRELLPEDAESAFLVLRIRLKVEDEEIFFGRLSSVFSG